MTFFFNFSCQLGYNLWKLEEALSPFRIYHLYIQGDEKKKNSNVLIKKECIKNLHYEHMQK